MPNLHSDSSAAKMDSNYPYRSLSPDISLGPVHLQIADLDRSIDYYTRVLGFTVLHRSEPQAQTQPQASLGINGSEKALIHLVEKKGVTPVPRLGRLGLYHFAILLPNRGQLGALLEHLAHIEIRVGMADHAVSEAIYLTDPDGLGIEVYADRPRHAWRWVNHQVHMVTEPLDVNGLIQNARDKGMRWAGMPEGTVMGHVHLHVEDVDKAAALYHEGIGFDKTVSEYPGALFMSAGGYHHHLAVNVWARGAPEPTDNDARMLEWTLYVPASDDIDTIHESLTGHPQEFRYEKAGDDLMVTDPWGTTVRITRG